MPDVTALPRPGDTFAGKYLIEGVIGRGKASLVFDARHRMTGRRFAIEWLVPRADRARHDAVIDDDEDTSDRAAAVGGGAGDDFVSVDEPDEVCDADELVKQADDLDSSEHRVIGHFRHPNVLEVYDVGEAFGSLYTVMDWSDGESLEARIQRAGPMSVREACRLLIPCMRGMHEAHAAGILHRDLKPSNIFICQAARSSPEIVKVLDFEVTDDASAGGGDASLVLHRGLSASKPYYRAPEQLGGLEIDHRADVYAFGAILYEVLSGRPPFVPMRHMIRDDDATPVGGGSASLQARPERLPPGADAIVSRAMARDVSQRFQTLHELAEALEAFCTRTPRALISGAPHYDVESLRQMAGYPTPRQLDSSFAVASSVPRARPRPHPRTIPEPAVSRELSSRESPPRRETPEWSEAPSSREASHWSDEKTSPSENRLPHSTHAPFYTETSFQQGESSYLPSLPIPRGKGVYVVSGLVVLAVAGLLASRYWSSLDTEVVATFEAVANPEVAVVELEPESPPPLAAVERAEKPTALHAGMRQAEPIEPNTEQLARMPGQTSGASKAAYAVPGGVEALASERRERAEAPLYRLPLSAPGTEHRPQQTRRRSRAASPVTTVAEPTPVAPSAPDAKPAPARRAARPTPAPEQNAHPTERPAAARSGDQLPMQLM